MQPLAVTIEEAMQMLRLSRSTLYRYRRAGKLPTIRVGSRVLIRMEAVAAFLDAHTLLAI